MYLPCTSCKANLNTIRNMKELRKSLKYGKIIMATREYRATMAEENIM